MWGDRDVRRPFVGVTRNPQPRLLQLPWIYLEVNMKTSRLKHGCPTRLTGTAVFWFIFFRCFVGRFVGGTYSSGDPDIDTMPMLAWSMKMAEAAKGSAFGSFMIAHQVRPHFFFFNGGGSYYEVCNCAVAVQCCVWFWRRFLLSFAERGGVS